MVNKLDIPNQRKEENYLLDDPLTAREEKDRRLRELDVVNLRPQPSNELDIPEIPENLKGKLDDPLANRSTGYGVRDPNEPVTVDEMLTDTYLPATPAFSANDVLDAKLGVKEASGSLLSDIKGGVIDAVMATYLRGEIGYHNIANFFTKQDKRRLDLSAINTIQENPLLLGTLPWFSLSGGDTDPAEFNRASYAEQEFFELVKDPDASTTRRVVRDMSRFLMAYGLGTRFLPKGAGPRTYVAAPLADIAAFSMDEARISTLIAEADVPGLSYAFEEYIAANPDDTLAEGKFRQALEGIVLGRATDSVIGLIGKVWAGAKHIKTKIAGKLTGTTPSTQAMPSNITTRGALEAVDSRAAHEAQKILSQIPIKFPKNAPVEEKKVIEILSNTYKNKLKELGLWDVLDSVDQKAKMGWFANRAKGVFGEQGPMRPPSTITASKAKAWEDNWQANLDKVARIKQKQQQVNRAKMRTLFERSVVDRSGPFKRMLQKNAAGQEAHEKFVLARGASTKAAFTNKFAVREIYQQKVAGLPVWRPLSQKKRDLLDKVIMVRRLRQIKSVKPEWSEKGNPLSKESAEFYTSRLNQIRSEVGEAEYSDVMRRADEFFATTQRQLGTLYDSGVISREEFQTLSRFEYAPIKYIEELDRPIAQYIDQTGKPISVTGSGIQPLGKGTAQAIETNTELFLQEIIIRATTKAMKNEANVSLYNAAKTGMLSGAKLKIPKGQNKHDWMSIALRIKGKPKKLYLAREYAPMWAAAPEVIGNSWKQLGWASGSPIVRAGATGFLNPEFALANFPRDVMYGILTSDQYSAFLPRSVMQYTDDLKAVFADAVQQKGRFLDYINEGGGMELLTHQGIPGHATPAHTVTKDWLDAASYLNSTSEVVNRLAVRERALQNIIAEHGPGYIPSLADRQHATFIARTTIDFDQGGTTAKALNEIIPYINASVQGLRGYLRSYKKNPLKAGSYAAQLLGLYGAINIGNRLVNPEAASSIPEYVESNFIVLTTPYSYTDEHGDERHLYFKFPIDHSTVGLNVLAQSLNRVAFNEGLPSEKKIDAMRDVGSYLSSQFGIVPGATLPPTVQGLIAYAGNYDWWRQAPAWMGEQGIPPELEYRAGETPEFFRDFGELSGMSPSRLYTATRQVFPQNIFTNIAGWGYRKATEDVQRDTIAPLEKSYIEQLRESPGARRFLGFTSPHGRYADEIREISAEGKGPQVMLNRNVDLLTEKISRNVEGASIDMAAQWIQQEVPMEMQAKAMDRLVNNVKLDKVFKEIKYNENSMNLPTKQWWRQAASAVPQARAKLLVEHISAMENIEDDTDRRKAKSTLLKTMSQVPGFNPKNSQEYALALKKELELNGMSFKDFSD